MPALILHKASFYFWHFKIFGTTDCVSYWKKVWHCHLFHLGSSKCKHQSESRSNSLLHSFFWNNSPWGAVWYTVVQKAGRLLLNIENDYSYLMADLSLETEVYVVFFFFLIHRAYITLQLQCEFPCWSKMSIFEPVKSNNSASSHSLEWSLCLRQQMQSWSFCADTCP